MTAKKVRVKLRTKPKTSPKVVILLLIGGLLQLLITALLFYFSGWVNVKDGYSVSEKIYDYVKDFMGITSIIGFSAVLLGAIKLPGVINQWRNPAKTKKTSR